ncbi:MAG TPA: S41 family peptidase [Dongiaceae bacterium]|nr:S41 family peptidase [Dongiaceae bacterium]
MKRNAAAGLLCFAAIAAGSFPAAGTASPPPSGRAGTSAPREMSKFDRDQGRMMLGVIRNDLRDFYYDPTYHGIAFDQVFARAEDRIASAGTQAEIYAAIAETLLRLDDSHTYFVPPGWAGKIEFGWFTQMVGDDCYLQAVLPGSDAETQGLLKGDRVLGIDGATPTRESLSVMMYDQRLLAPRARTTLVVRSPGGEPREVVVRPRVTPQKRVSTNWDHAAMFREMEDQAWLDRHRFHFFGDDVAVWKMPQFDLTREEVGRIAGKLSKYPRLILDLRGNPGGAVETLEFMVGAFLGEKVPIGTIRSRRTIPAHVSRKSPERYDGELIVLVDSESASAAEIFSRQMQIAARGKVLGDRTSGRVMMSEYHDRKIGMGTTVYFGASITIADIIMTDGRSLEKSGVTPDEVILPTGEDLATGRDPVLSRAAAAFGVNIDPEKAGALFPFEWKR